MNFAPPVRVDAGVVRPEKSKQGTSGNDKGSHQRGNLGLGKGRD